MYKITVTQRFIKDSNLCKRRGLNMNLLREAMQLLAETGTLPTQYHPHKLKGDYEGFWECHIQPDWLLVWMQNDLELIMLFSRTGTHSDLF